MTVRLLTGDCRDVLRTLPDASVQCVVSSPPYFGLRDYGTASWEGGDAGCDHKGIQERGSRERRLLPLATTTFDNIAAAESAAATYREACGKCGARRIDQQIGLESSVDEYVAQMVAVFREVRRVLRPDGTVWLNLGDSYASAWPAPNTRRNIIGNPMAGGKRGPQRQSKLSGILKEKDLMMIPARVAMALQADGWYLRSDIIWSKPNPMPESVSDRCAKSHEYVFLLSKSARYYYDAEAIKEPCESGPSDIRKMNEGLDRIGGLHKDLDDPLIAATGLTNIGRKRSVGDPSGRNCRSVWTIATEPFPGSHFAVFPKALAERCIKAGTSERGACAACGAPWVRVVERGERVGASRGGNFNGEDQGFGVKVMKGGYEPGMHYETIDLGWRASCTCNADVVPCVVLDPFSGSGTVSLVSERLGRDSIGIDLSPVYTDMAAKRIRADCPMFAAVETV